MAGRHLREREGDTIPDKKADVDPPFASYVGCRVNVSNHLPRRGIEGALDGGCLGKAPDHPLVHLRLKVREVVNEAFR